MERIIGQHTEGKAGPLVIVFGGAHGNEPAGVTALQEVFKLLGQEYQSNPGFEFNGKIIGLIGNLRAYSTGQRFIDKDLNRLWTSENIQRIREAPCRMSSKVAFRLVIQLIDRTPRGAQIQISQIARIVALPCGHLRSVLILQ